MMCVIGPWAVVSNDGDNGIVVGTLLIAYSVYYVRIHSRSTAIQCINDRERDHQPHHEISLSLSFDDDMMLHSMSRSRSLTHTYMRTSILTSIGAFSYGLDDLLGDQLLLPIATLCGAREPLHSNEVGRLRHDRLLCIIHRIIHRIIIMLLALLLLEYRTPSSTMVRIPGMRSVDSRMVSAWSTSRLDLRLLSISSMVLMLKLAARILHASDASRSHCEPINP